MRCSVYHGYSSRNSQSCKSILSSSPPANVSMAWGARKMKTKVHLAVSQYCLNWSHQIVSKRDYGQSSVNPSFHVARFCVQISTEPSGSLKQLVLVVVVPAFLIYESLKPIPTSPEKPMIKTTRLPFPLLLQNSCHFPQRLINTYQP